MRTKVTALETFLNRKMTVTLPSGKLERMTRRQAMLTKYAMDAANGNLAALGLLIDIAQSAADEDQGIVVKSTPA